MAVMETTDAVFEILAGKGGGGEESHASFPAATTLYSAPRSF